MSANKKRRTDKGPELAPINGHPHHHLNGATQLAVSAVAADSRRKRSAASRIGRACDRCQHRKLACDPAPEGCPPCQKVNAWCTVTDPLTGTPTYRGEFEYLERRVAKQQHDIELLLGRLRSLGQDTSDVAQEETPEDRRYGAWIQVKASGDTRPWDRDERSSGAARRNGPPPIPKPEDYDRSVSRDRHISTTSSPELPERLAPESFVGLTTSRGHPVSSRLNMFGWEIDLADFTAPDADDFGQSPTHDNPVYDRSYRGSCGSIYGLQTRLSEPDMPSKVQFLHYAEAALGVLNPYIPILHKTTFMAMVDQVYDHPETQPSIEQKAILHMVCANITMHMAARNQDQPKAQMDQIANAHYHYVLGHFGKLLAGESIEHVQALALICCFTRNFPKPEVCWTVSNRTLFRLIELGYHRAPKKQRRGSDNLSFYETEMQKRLFWVILICAANTSGKLGRPMPLRAEDYDVEFPSSIPDDALNESGGDKQQRIMQGHCEIKPHIELSKLTPVYIEVYSTIYTAKRSNADYRTFVNNIEGKLKKWQEQWPVEYQNTSRANELDKMSIAFLNFFLYELKLLLHHPSLSMTKDGHPNHDDLRICLSVSHGMLQNVREMQRLRALEGTWHNCSIFMLAIQTTLYGHKMLCDEMTPKRLEELKTDMMAWLSIIGDMGILIGSGDRLQLSVGSQIQGGLAPLQQHVQAKGARSVPAPLHKSESQSEVKVEPLPTPSTASSHTPQMSTNQFAGYGTTATTPTGSASTTTSYQQLPSPGYQSQVYQHMQHQQQQQQTPSYPYPEPSPTNMPASYNSSAPGMPSNYQSVANGGYSMGINGPGSHAPHTGPATVNGYGSQQQQQQPPPPPPPPPSQQQQQQQQGPQPQQQQQQQQQQTSQQPGPSPQAHAYTNGYYSTYSPQQQAAAVAAASADTPTSWLQYTQGIHSAVVPRSPQPGGGTGAAPGAGDYQPAAASALLQLGGNGVGFDAVVQWPMGFINDRNGYDDRR